MAAKVGVLSGGNIPHYVFDEGAAVAGANVRAENYVNGLNKTVITFVNRKVALTDAAGVVAYGGTKVLDFPQGKVDIHSCVTDLAITKTSAGVNATFDGDMSVGTAAAGASATLDGTEADVIPSTALPQAVAGATTGDASNLPPVVVDTIPLENFKLPTLLQMAASAASGVFGLVSGTHGSASATLVGEAASGNTKTSVARILYKLPEWYKQGSAITVRIAAKVATGLATASDSLDLQVFKIDKAAGVGSDLCTTAAKTTLTTSYADYDFTITPTGLSAGDVLDMEITSVENDTGGTVGSVITISNVEVRVTQSTGKFISLDGTGTAKDLYVNFLVDDADHDVTTTPCSLVLNGKLYVTWSMGGDN